MIITQLRKWRTYLMKNHDKHVCNHCLQNPCECNENHNPTGSPFQSCQEKIPTPRYRSPNSPLPPAQLDELQKCIETANDLLRSLGTERDPENQRQLQLHFLELHEILVRVKVKGFEKRYEEVGSLMTAGKNFIELNTVGKRVLIPFVKIDSIQYEGKGNDKKHHQELIHLNRQIKRELVLHFGEFVSRHPELVNLFFGIPLHLMLVQYKERMVNLKVEEQSDVVSGKLVEMEENFLQIFKNDESVQIPLEKICLVEIENE
jgi:hypothetical protein